MALIKKRFTLWIALGACSAAIAVGLAGCDSGTPAQTVQRAEQSSEKMKATVNDGVITGKIKSAYLADELVKGLSINVTTTSGNVELDGKVGSEAERNRALQIARATAGVRQVVDKLAPQ